MLAAPAATAGTVTAGTATAGTRLTATTANVTTAVPKFAHVFLIMEENNGFQVVIGNKAAPNLNYLANTFGLETDYYGLGTESSETNYVGPLGGSTYGVTSDDA
jgi:phosphatidylinositol-3-phosphatase